MVIDKTVSPKIVIMQPVKLINASGPTPDVYAIDRDKVRQRLDYEAFVGMLADNAIGIYINEDHFQGVVTCYQIGGSTYYFMVGEE